ncbi:MAG: hypothetical protein KGZ85_00865 [Ignavibacterium sp.]|nr:hypothetical protein [Ignavibacterium sp.]
MEVLAALQTLAEGKYQRSTEINFLVEKTYSLATGYLGLNHKKIFKLLQKGEYCINEIAIDAIAILFVPDKEKNIIPLANSFKKWHPPIETENDALYFLNRIVAGRIEQHIFSSLREYDPFFSKILDSVNYLVKTGNYKKISLAGRSCIIEKDGCDLRGNIIDCEEFDKIPVSILADRKNLLNSVFEYLKNRTVFSAVIPINLLVYRIKHINFSEYVAQFNPSVRTKDFEIEEFTSFGFNTAKIKLELSYLQKGKLNEFESTCISNALKDMSKDLSDGGISPGMYEYLTVYMKDLDKEQYLTKYHNILEYLVKVMKNTIAEKLSQEN